MSSEVRTLMWMVSRGGSAAAAAGNAVLAASSNEPADGTTVQVDLLHGRCGMTFNSFSAAERASLFSRWHGRLASVFPDAVVNAVASP